MVANLSIHIAVPRRTNEKNHKFTMMALLSNMSGPHCNCIDIPIVNIRGPSFHNIMMSFYDSENNIASTGAFRNLCYLTYDQCYNFL